jgi:SAM-dependent methyltransferase
MSLFRPDTCNRLNLGCGRSILQDWINLDSMALPGVDVVFDLELASATSLPFPDSSIDEFLLSHVVEHIRNVLGLMQELHRVAKPGAVAWVRVPHGASDDAFEDPTHVRVCFPGSFGYFSQPYYWRADYGYRGDWDTESVTLRVSGTMFGPDISDAQILARIDRERNLVHEMVVKLRAIKPIRQPRRDLQSPSRVVIERI